MEWLTPVTASPLQHRMPWIPPYPLPDTPPSPGATCVSSILKASFSSCVPRGKPSLPSVWWDPLRWDHGPLSLIQMCSQDLCGHSLHMANDTNCCLLGATKHHWEWVMQLSRDSDNGFFTSPTCPSSPVPSPSHFWVMGMKLCEAGQAEGHAQGASGSCPALWASICNRAGPTLPHRSHHTKAEPESPIAVIVPGAQPASYSPSATRSDSGPSQCHRGERLKGTKPSKLSGSKGMVQAQPRQLPELALGLVELHPKAVDSGSPSKC